MKHLKNKKVLWITAAVMVVLAVALLGQNTLTGTGVYTVKKTGFESSISVKGEIQGKNAVLISFPDELKHRDLRIREFEIKDLIEEGTLVKKGDWVATLDIDNINQQIQYNNDDLERRLAEFNDAKIDSAIELTNFREELKELGYDLQYRELDLEQAQYESPAYQRKVQVAYNKTIRQIEKRRRDYELRRLNLAVRTKRREDRYNFTLHRDSLLRQALEAATITSPGDGTVMYARTRRGRKIRIGDNVSQWQPTIANLPDMSELISETYVEEIQITKLKIGDSVEVTVDAIPGKVYTGRVYRIANIGQEISGMDAKVFNVLIDITNSDASLRPAMTSNNRIILHNRQNVLTIPRECLFSEDGENFVYLKKSGTVYKQPVTAGVENDSEIIILSGLDENDRILFSAPENASEVTYYEEFASN
ncbi:MAG TPA: HlyD family efflux transporter periplasmic adaptor subunit [Mariniphaga anaerophila]|uniref:HlyD family efflux transporter periplasmic adaptor subunit n=1 Tax=Mariniphaga anaerophila TaxID=1484053 RepID=A0A831LAQ1_9BACT|nr:HlyD family efflux transporter periplasmic adaptor subunit [Mariniphaga anaerophila]